jgi:hypothetical protein
MKEFQTLLDEALAHNSTIGGSRVISYGGMEILAPVRDIIQAMDWLRNGDRRQIVAHLNATLARNFPNVSNGTASQKLAMQTGQDIAIWFANEVIEGRATLEIN